MNSAVQPFYCVLLLHTQFLGGTLVSSDSGRSDRDQLIGHPGMADHHRPESPPFNPFEVKAVIRLEFELPVIIMQRTNWTRSS
jgi:hypothetical protein